MSFFVVRGETVAQGRQDYVLRLTHGRGLLHALRGKVTGSDSRMYYLPVSSLNVRQLVR